VEKRVATYADGQDHPHGKACALSTIIWVLVGGGVWVLFNLAILALLAAARTGPGPAPADIRATGELVGRLAEDVLGVLGVERVAVVMHDPATPDRGVVEACCGRPELVGSTVPVTGGFGWGAGPESDFLVADQQDGGWAVVSIPIAVDTGLTGTVAVATRRPRGLTASDVALLERLGSRAARHSDRQQEAATRFDRRTQRDIVA
jgi:hypothetical protein